jgi:hypothetical protein
MSTGLDGEDKGLWVVSDDKLVRISVIWGGLLTISSAALQRH